MWRTLTAPGFREFPQNSFLLALLGRITVRFTVTADHPADCCHPSRRYKQHSTAFLGRLWRKTTTGVPEISICITAYRTKDKVAILVWHFRMITGLEGFRFLARLNRFLKRGYTRRTEKFNRLPATLPRWDPFNQTLVSGAVAFPSIAAHESKRSINISPQCAFR